MSSLTLGAHYRSLRSLDRFWSVIFVRKFKNYNFFLAIFRKFGFLQKKNFFDKFFSCVKNFKDTFKLHELILRCLENIREFFQVDRMSNCEMVIIKMCVGSHWRRVFSVIEKKHIRGLIWLIFFRFLLHCNVMKLWSYQTFGWECACGASLRRVYRYIPSQKWDSESTLYTSWWDKNL